MDSTEPNAVAPDTTINDPDEQYTAKYISEQEEKELRCAEAASEQRSFLVKLYHGRPGKSQVLLGLDVLHPRQSHTRVGGPLVQAAQELFKGICKELGIPSGKKPKRRSPTPSGSDESEGEEEARSSRRHPRSRKRARFSDSDSERDEQLLRHERRHTHTRTMDGSRQALTRTNREDTEQPSAVAECTSGPGQKLQRTASEPSLGPRGRDREKLPDGVYVSGAKCMPRPFLDKGSRDRYAVRVPVSARRGRGGHHRLSESGGSEEDMDEMGPNDRRY